MPLTTATPTMAAVDHTPRAHTQAQGQAHVRVTPGISRPATMAKGAHPSMRATPTMEGAARCLFRPARLEDRMFQTASVRRGRGAQTARTACVSSSTSHLTTHEINLRC